MFFYDVLTLTYVSSDDFVFLNSFYPTSLEEAFHQCLTSLGQQKYSIAFPLLCSHFMSATNPFCPEEVRE